MMDVKDMTDGQLDNELEDMEDALGYLESAEECLREYGEDFSGIYDIYDAVNAVKDHIKELKDEIGERNYKANMAVMRESYGY